MRLAIFTLTEDLHGYLVAEQLRLLGHQCHIVATDQLGFSPWLEWHNKDADAQLTDIDGERFNCAQLNAIWWRRVNTPMQNMPALEDEAAYKLIPNECRAALMGTLFTAFDGRWVNDPAAELRADNKFVQLRTARAVGFEVPDTLVSNDPTAIRQFVQGQGGSAVVKVVRGLADFSVPARRVTAKELSDDASITACPAIWQGLVPGQTHLRVHVFGAQLLAVQIHSQKLDWRPDLTSPMQEYKLDTPLKTQCFALVKELGLEMGIIDIKLTPEHNPVFLEINPQGQFAFVEGLTGLPLSRLMAESLVQVSVKALRTVQDAQC